jgi:2-polyprenyl-3-methyl-5-hydroxy-6-metoxy-1,4-benzoquinol methylase
MIVELPFVESQGLANELAVHRAHSLPNLISPIGRFTDLNTFLSERSRWDNAHAYLDFFELTENLRNASILDVGVGLGYTSLFLAARGNKVTAVEPSLECCRALEWHANRFGLAIDVYRTTGESITAVPGLFDVVIFHSSLHHADNPVAALEAAREKLRAGGQILLISESILKFFRSKAWFARMLIENPEKIGHYGGNEHVYRSYEYVSMLRQAGFKDIQILPSLMAYSPDASLLKRAFRTIVRAVQKNPIAFKLLDALSLPQVTYRGMR